MRKRIHIHRQFHRDVQKIIRALNERANEKSCLITSALKQENQQTKSEPDNEKSMFWEFPK